LTDKDRLFKDPKRAAAFEFDADVARVFDDMVSRSVPSYDEIQAMIAELSGHFFQSGTFIYDLGCSTGNTLRQLAQSLQDKKARFIGVDGSPDMLKKCPLAKNIELVEHDLNKALKIENASVVILNLTLQFVKPDRRLPLLKSIHAGLKPEGALILIEKTTPDAVEFKDLFTALYHDFKRRQNYSQTEIANKDAALQNVLIPFSPQGNKKLLSQAGFTIAEPFFQWYNFCGFLAVK
jgi:tRNA (cmo5U34)-methyltransferase